MGNLGTGLLSLSKTSILLRQAAECARLFITAAYLIRIPQKNRTNRMCASIYLSVCLSSIIICWGIYFKELAHVIMVDGKSKMCRVGRQPGDPERANITVKSKGQALAEFPLACGRSYLCCIRIFSWLDEVHPRCGGQSALLRVNQFKC